MRRSLVLTDEAARHPFRASLPPYIRASAAPHVDRVARWRRDISGVAGTYFATLAATLVMIM